MQGYLIINGSFKFPSNVKYPSIPCYIDEASTIYPLEGSCLLTGPEFIVARNQGCEFKVKSSFYIPPTTEKTTDYKNKNKNNDNVSKLVLPFHDILKELQLLRKQHPKGSFLNLLYKDIGNSIYGNVVRGVSNKKVFDSLTGQMTRVKGTDLSNPILAS
jgi:hypothetical protein